MIKKFVEKWNRYKENLENYFRNTKQEEYQDYEDIVKALFKNVINQGETDHWNKFNIEEMTLIDDGDYQGTQIFIIPLDTYQPNIEDYVVTNTYYGSCSGCDTLLAINEFSSGLPSEEQIHDYMMLALHLLQKCKWLEEE
jgi:hypothetical protein